MLAELRADVERANDAFESLLETRFPGLTRYHWFRALSAAKGENYRRNDDTSHDEAMASDADLRAAHQEYTRELHVFYAARDGSGGFLGGKGL